MIYRKLNNQLFGLPYTGIGVMGGDGSSNSRETDISFNRVEEVMQRMEDGGAIYTYFNQPGITIRSNFLRRQRDKYSDGALYFDEGSAGVTATDNVVDQAPLWLWAWSDNTRDLKVSNTYTNVTGSDYDRATRLAVSGTVAVKGTEWPDAAKAVIASAGIEVRYRQGGADYRPLLALPGASSGSNIGAVPAALTASAGPNVTVALTEDALLEGSYGDPDPVLTPARLSWKKASGPGTVTFADTAAARTTAAFSQAGSYTLELRVEDDAGSVVSVVTVNVADRPIGSNIAKGKPSSAGSVLDNGWQSRHVNDDDKSSSWLSKWGGPNWVQLDLGSDTGLRRVELQTRDLVDWGNERKGMVVLGSNESSFSNGQYTVLASQPDGLDQEPVPNGGTLTWNISNAGKYR